MSNGIDVNFLIRKISNRFTIYIAIEELKDLTKDYVKYNAGNMPIDTNTHTIINVVILLKMALSVEYTEYFNRTRFENGIKIGVITFICHDKALV